jgi:Tfp pilus assembly protein PilZ
MSKAALSNAEEGVPPESVLTKLRIPFVRRATLTHEGGGQEEVFIIDVGLSGVFIERSKPLPVGVEVEIRLSLPGNEIPFAARCRVAWWHPAGQPLASKELPAGAGLEFVELSEIDRSRLREQLEEYCRQHPRVRRFLRHWPEAERKGDDP